MSVSLSVSANSAIYDYATLLAECADELDRDDLTGKFPRFIQEVESDLKRRLRTMDMELTVTLTASAETVALPADYVAMRSIYVEGSPDSGLRGMAPAALAQEFSGETGPRPYAYAQVGGVLKLAPPPAASLSLEMTYLAAFAPLTVITTTNWIVVQYPDIYFNGVCALALRYAADLETASAYADRYEKAVEDLKAARARDRWGSGPLVPNVVRQVRGAVC